MNIWMEIFKIVKFKIKIIFYDIKKFEMTFLLEKYLELVFGKINIFDYFEKYEWTK